MKRILHLFVLPLLAGFVAAGAVQSLFSAYAVQNEMVPPTSGIFTGVQYSQKIGDAFKSIASGNKGASAPANVGGATVDGLRWIDDTTSTWIKKTYVNGGWAVEGAYGASDSSWIGLIGGGVPASIASTATVDLGSVPQANVLITGTATVTGFGSSAAAGIIKVIRFDNSLKLMASASLKIPCGFDLTTAANDRAIVTHLGSGTWEVTQFTRDNGLPLDCAALGQPAMSFQAIVPELHLPGDGRAITRTSYPAYTSKMTLAQNGTRVSGNATITLANTSGVGAGMPVEGTGINAGCVISTFVANTSITLNSSSCVTSSGTSTVTVFPTGYGASGSSSTIGVPDCQGRAIAGMDGGTGRLTSSYFGAYANSINVAGGNEKYSILQTNLPTYNLSPTITQPTFSSSTPATVAQTDLIGGGGTGPRAWLYNGGGSATITRTTDVAITIPLGGSNTPFATVSPMLTARCNIRVIP